MKNKKKPDAAVPVVAELVEAVEGTETATPEQITEILQLLYTPAASPADADEALTPTDIYEALNQYIDPNRLDIMHAMKKAGFLSTTIEGQPYWLVKYKE